MKRIAIGLLPVLALAGCKAGPDYHVPDNAMAKSPSANRPFVGGAEPAFTQADLPAHWWHLYNDPRLDAYVEEALKANTDRRAADANLRRAGDVVREVEAGRTVQTKIEAAAFGARIRF